MTDDGTKPPSITPKKSSSARGRPTSGRTGSGGRSPAAAKRAPAVKESSASSSTTSTDTGANGSSTKTDEAETSSLRATSTSVDGERADSVSGDGAGTRDGTGAGAGSGAGTGARSSAGPLGGATPPAPAPGKQPRPVAVKTGQGRRVRLAISKVDPWSVMKLSFLLSVAIGIMIVVAAAVVWMTLDSMAVFTQLNSTIAEITGDPDFFNVLEYASFDRVISLATMVAVVDIVILTALATIGAFLYNIVAALVGGIHVTLTDD